MKTLFSTLCMIAFSACSGQPRAVSEEIGSTVIVCEVHGVELLEETVMPAPLTVEFDPYYEQAVRTHFPNLGLAFAMDHSESDSAVVLYCPQCREANGKWIQEN